MSDLVVITGATGGIGQCVARRLGERGLVPVIGHRAAKSAAAKQIADACGGLPLVLDMADPRTIDDGIEHLVANGRPVAGVVIAASPAPTIGPFAKITAADHALFWTANVVGPHHLLAGLVRRCFRTSKTGSAVAVLSKAMNLTTAAGEEPRAMSSMGAYTFSKFGLQGVMAQLLADYPWLTVACVKPGFTETDMLTAFDGRFLDQLRAQQHFSSPDEIATDIIRRLALKPR